MKWTFTLELSVCRIGTKVLRILEIQLGDQGVRFYFCLSTFVLYKMFKFHKNTKVHKEPLFSFIRPLLHCAETDPLPAHFMKPKRIVIKLHNSFTYFTKKYLTILRNIIYVCLHFILRFFFFCVPSRFHFRWVLPFSSSVWNRQDMTLLWDFYGRLLWNSLRHFTFFKLSGNKC